MTAGALNWRVMLTRRAPKTFISVLAAVGLLMSGCAQITALVEDLPRLTKKDLRFKPPQSSFVFARDGSLITSFHGVQNRTVIPLGKIPEKVQEAVLAIEDERFYEHDGVDMRAVGRALITNIREGEIEEGGSTITQQYVKNVIISPNDIAERSFERKITEAALARQIEKELTKKEILERYLNTVYFGAGAYGIQAASRTYFNRRAKDLSLSQAALLAGVIQSPEDYNPYREKQAALERRDVVLRQMENLGFITPEESAKATSAKLKLQKAVEKDTYAAPYFVDYVRRLITYDPRFKFLGKNPIKREQQILTGGLRIYTTVDLEMQAAAEEAVRAVLIEDTDPHASLVAMEPDTGYVRAMVGGRDYFAKKKHDRFAKLNLAIQGEPRLGKGGKAPGTGRQAGSAFKPFALAAALENGTSLSEVYPASGDEGGCKTFPTSYESWRVCNYEGAAYGAMSLLEGTVKSVNIVYAQLILDTGAEAVVELASNMGIGTPLLAVNSAALGTNEVNPLGMATGYATFAADGLHTPPVAITKIIDANGKTLYEDHTESEQVLEPEIAYMVTTALQQVIQRGTGTAALGIGRPAAGKTGTAQEYRDAWFGGYTPDLVAAVWVGYPEGAIEMKPSCPTVIGCRPTRIQVTGGSWPTQIWTLFMARALANVPASDFEVPAGAGTVSITIDTRTGCVANRTTPKEFKDTAEYPLGAQPECVAPIDEKKKKKNKNRDEDDDEATEPRPSGGGNGGGGGQSNNSNERTVPSVLGYTRPAAEDALRNQGFSVNVIFEAESNPGQARRRRGRVWKQSPGGGDSAPRGSTVTIWVNPS
jgi:penicillin-binding protein 1A